MTDKYYDMSDDDLIKALKDYAFTHEDTEAGDMANAASIRIAVLVSKILKEDEE